MTGAHIGFLTGSIGFLAGLGAKIWIDYLTARSEHEARELVADLEAHQAQASGQYSIADADRNVRFTHDYPA